MDELDKKIIEKINKNEEVPKSFTQSIQKALYKEDNKFRNKIFEFTKIAATACAGVILVGGVGYAGYEVYEKIWKNPERVDISNQEITEEIEEKNITEEEAKEKAISKLEEFGFENEVITKTDNYKESGTENIVYRFYTNNKWLISINGQTGEFDTIILEKFDKSWENYIMSREEAIETAKEFYNQFGYKDGEYELTMLRAFDKEGKGNEDGYEFFATFCKKYDGIKNEYESIQISFYAKDKQLSMYSVQNSKFDNNPIEITKEEAIEIAKAEDRKVETNEIIDTNVEIRIKKMNGNAYARFNNTEEYYKPMTTVNVPANEHVYYKTEDRVRRVWVVVFNYGEVIDENKTEEERLVERVTKGQYSYFVDCTTGEIIGGDSSDYLRWDNHWAEYYAVE